MDVVSGVHWELLRVLCSCVRERFWRDAMHGQSVQTASYLPGRTVRIVFPCTIMKSFANFMDTFVSCFGGVGFRRHVPNGTVR